MTRFRLVIDFDDDDEGEANYVATLLWIHMKQILRSRGLDPDDTITFHGVRPLGGDSDR